jgi:hypothetical protein
MVEWEMVAIAILAIALVLLSLIIFKILPATKEWSKAAFRQARYTFCCNVLGCQPGLTLSWSKLNPLCSLVCWGCACGESC